MHAAGDAAVAGFPLPLGVCEKSRKMAFWKSDPKNVFATVLGSPPPALFREQSRRRDTPQHHSVENRVLSSTLAWEDP